MATESAPSEAWARSSEASPWCGLGPSPQGEADRLRPRIVSEQRITGVTGYHSQLVNRDLRCNYWHPLHVAGCTRCHLVQADNSQLLKVILVMSGI